MDGFRLFGVKKNSFVLVSGCGEESNNLWVAKILQSILERC